MAEKDDPHANPESPRRSQTPEPRPRPDVNDAPPSLLNFVEKLVDSLDEQSKPADEITNKLEDLKGPNGQSAMHVAAAAGKKDWCNTMQTNGMDINAQDSNGATPLDYAARNQQQENKEWLAQHGAKAGIAQQPDHEKTAKPKDENQSVPKPRPENVARPDEKQRNKESQKTKANDPTMEEEIAPGAPVRGNEQGFINEPSPLQGSEHGNPMGHRAEPGSQSMNINPNVPQGPSYDERNEEGMNQPTGGSSVSKGKGKGRIASEARPTPQSINDPKNKRGGDKKGEPEGDSWATLKKHKQEQGIKNKPPGPGVKERMDQAKGLENDPSAGPGQKKDKKVTPFEIKPDPKRK